MQGSNEAETVIIEERITKVNGDFHIKKYARGKLLGKGGFAKVYHFTNLETNKILAGKVMPKANLTKSRSRQKLMTEIRLHKSLHHANIVKFEHVFEDQENVYILLELCEHQSLSELVKRRKRLTEIEVQSYSMQIIDGLKYLHANRIIHRDLKLGNIFLSDKMQVKLGDFGLAAKLEFDGERKRTVCGTPNYLAPEILDGKSGHSYHVDVWALGVVMYAMLFGRPPFETTDVKTTYKKIKANEYVFPDVGVSEHAKDLIKNILVSEPDKRLSFEEILQHPFFNGGLIPKLLPVSTLACPPTNSYIKQFSSTSTTPRPKITTEAELQETLDIFKSPKNTFLSTPKLSGPTGLTGINGMSGLTSVRSPGNGFTASDIFKTTPRNPPTKTDLLASPKITTLANLGLDHAHLGIEHHLILETPKPVKVKASRPSEHIKEVPSTAPLKTQEIQTVVGKQQEKDEIEESIRVVKWHDYSSKYGLGYLLSNGTIGVFFNDGSKLIGQNENTFDYIVRNNEKQDVSTTYSFKDYPTEVHKKVLVFNRFKEHFEPTQKTLVKQEAFIYVKKWIKTKHGIFFRMNNRVLQVVFQDETILIMNSDSKKLLFINNKGENYVSGIESASTSGPKDLVKRLKYTEEVLSHIWTAQTEVPSNKIEKSPVKESEAQGNNPVLRSTLETAVSTAR